MKRLPSRFPRRRFQRYVEDIIDVAAYHDPGFLQPEDEYLLDRHQMRRWMNRHHDMTVVLDAAWALLDELKLVR